MKLQSKKLKLDKEEKETVDAIEKDEFVYVPMSKPGISELKNDCSKYIYKNPFNKHSLFMSVIYCVSRQKQLVQDSHTKHLFLLLYIKKLKKSKLFKL